MIIKKIDDINIKTVIERTIEKNKRVLFIIIGVEKNYNKEIDECIKKYPENVIIKPEMEHKKLLEYISIADIVLDSFPMSGGTAMLDACYYNKPIVSGCSLVGQMDYLMKSGEYSYTIEDIIVKLDKLINSEDERKKNIENIQKSLKDNDSIDEFKERLRKLYSILPEKHKVYKLDEEIVNNKYCDVDVFKINIDKKRKKILDCGFLKYLKKKIDMEKI